MPDDERLVEVPEVVESDSPAQPVRSHELPQLLHDVLQQFGVLLPRPLVEPNGEPGERRVCGGFVICSFKYNIRYVCLTKYGASEAVNLCSRHVEKSTKYSKQKCASYFRE